MLIGSHVRSDNPLQGALDDEADLVQFFLGDPQSWKKPPPRADADLLKRSPIPIYVHAPYLINVASTNNRIRIPGRKLLQQHLNAAAEIGAKGLVVHGGHVENAEQDEESGDSESQDQDDNGTRH